ncbi:MAG: methylmalonyl-CoA mutase family protein [Chloroflexota bacterium]
MTISDKQSATGSAIPLAPYYDEGDGDRKAPPGVFPYARGVRSDGYRTKPWTMRQYSGFGTARETNQRFHYLLREGQTGLSTAFDLPTQMGYDSDNPRAVGEVGRVGVAIDTLADMEVLLDNIPLDAVSTSMTINATASTLLLLYQLVAEQRGIPGSRLNGTVQNDILKEYAARGTYIYPPRQSMRLITDLMAYARDHLPQWNTVSISGYHMREAGSTAVQEVAFTLANALAYAEAAVVAGMDVDDFAPRLSFFFNAHSDFFEEVAKFRAARMLWAETMRDRLGARNERSLVLRFHTQTGGSTLTAQQPLNNVVRVALQALSAVLGGTQSLHTNGYDEAVSLPSQEAATLALRTQQIIASETGVTAVADPLGGSYFVEYLTDQIADRARSLIHEIDEAGGAVAAIESGHMQRLIEDSAYDFQRAVDRRDKVVVGVNTYVQADDPPMQVPHVDPRLEHDQCTRLTRIRAERDNKHVNAALKKLEVAARGTDNILIPMKEALKAYATIGEVSDALRRAFGTYDALHA